MKRELHLALALLFTLAALATTTLPARGQIFVDQSVTTPGDGTSWDKAYKELSDALAAAVEGDQIWVAAGTYYPQDITDESDEPNYVPSTNPRDRAFVIPPGVNVYGGFAGTETTSTDRDKRNWKANPTILSGDIGKEDDNTDNCYHVVIMALLYGQTATLDGFTVTGGNANGDGRITVNELLFYRNEGGGVYAPGSATLTNNTIYGNKATNGGGVYAYGSGTLTNNTIYGNEANNGGGVFATLGAILINNTIYDNEATYGGGVLADATTTLHNNILWKNNAGSGEDLYVNGSSASGSHNLIGKMDGELSGTNPLTGPTHNPHFIDPANGDFRLGIHSAAINAGSDRKNIGAWPTVALVPTGEILYINRTVDITGADYKGDGSSWSNALSDLGEALAFAKENPNEVSEIRVAKGTYIPKYPSDVSSTNDRDAYFSIPTNVRVYGGFAGTEGETFADRNWTKNKTILSGDIGEETKDDNCFNVVWLTGGTLDGFHITGGNGASYGFAGGGVVASSGATLTNNTIYGNTASSGGGVHASNGATLINNTIYGNTATFDGGGVFAGNVILTNNTIYGNTADSGGGVYVYGSGATLYNNILWKNNAGSGQDLYVLANSSARGSQNLIGKIVVEKSDGNDYVGTDDLIGPTNNPRFVNPDAYDFRLQEGSPAIDAGDDGAYEELENAPATDAAGNLRFNGKAIDIGAYEFQTADAAYHTLTLEVAPGIDCYGLTAGTHQLADGDHLHLQFLADDRTLGPDDVMLLIDGVDTPFTIPAAGSYYSYILNPIHQDHTILIALREYPVTLPSVPDGYTLTPGPGTHSVPYGEAFTFSLSGDFDPAALHVFANGLEIQPDALRSLTQSYTIDRVIGPVTISIDGNTTGNLDIAHGAIRLAMDNGQLTIDNSAATAVDVAVYTLTGQNVVHLRALRGSRTLTLPAGVYIVRAGEERWKVVVD